MPRRFRFNIRQKQPVVYIEKLMRLREAKFYGNISDTNQFGTCPLSTISLPKATALNSINIATGDAAKYIQAGSEFTLYGVKK